jgi:hypothetical protein
MDDRVVNTDKIEGFEQDVYVALDPQVWRDVHEIAQQIYGPTTRVYLGHTYADVPTTASGSGIENVLDRLVARGMAMEQRDAGAPMGKVWKRWP